MTPVLSPGKLTPVIDDDRQATTPGLGRLVEVWATMDTPPGAIPSLGNVAWAAAAASCCLLFVSFIKNSVIETCGWYFLWLFFASLRQPRTKNVQTQPCKARGTCVNQWSNCCWRSLFRRAFLRASQGRFSGLLTPWMSLSALMRCRHLFGPPRAQGPSFDQLSVSSTVSPSFSYLRALFLSTSCCPNHTLPPRSMNTCSRFNPPQNGSLGSTSTTSCMGSSCSRHAL
jgi:hypothetical protein